MSLSQRITAAPAAPQDGDDIEIERLRSAVEEARADARRGDLVPHERVRDWLLELAQGRKAPPPLP